MEIKFYFLINNKVDKYYSLSNIGHKLIKGKRKWS